MDIDTIEQRLDGRASIVSEFYGTAFGWCRGRFIPVDYDNDGRLLHVIYCIESIDEQKERENSLLSMAHTDLMTGIYNHGHGESLIEQSLHNKVKGMMCIIDCDKFKSINDTYGHSVGDDVIIAIAHTLQNVCRKMILSCVLAVMSLLCIFRELQTKRMPMKYLKEYLNIQKN